MTPSETEKLVRLLTDKDALVERLRAAMKEAPEDVKAKAQAEVHGESSPVLQPLVDLFRDASPEYAMPVLWDLFVHALADILAENNRNILRILDADE